MYEKVEKCPICNGQDFKNFIICEDHTVSHESFVITKCANCDLLLTNPRPSQNQIEKYCLSKDNISHSNKSNSLINIIYKIAINFTLRGKLNLINKLNTEKTILDYGCGTGFFLDYCKKNNWKVTGIESDESARKLASVQVGESIFSKLKIKEHTTKYDIITLWHVLEHVHTLTALLDNLKSILKKNGYLIIAVPNSDALDAKIYKENWAAYDVPRHLYHFNQLTFSELIKYQGYKLVATHPMKLDSYYISMLSEKQQNGKNNHLKAILNGWKSNTWASKNNNNYSSLIYVLKKR